MAIQRYNTLAIAYARLKNREADRQAGANYQKAYQLAVSYQDSVWMGIVWGNLGDSYAKQGQWQHLGDAGRWLTRHRRGPKLRTPPCGGYHRFGG